MSQKPLSPVYKIYGAINLLSSILIGLSLTFYFAMPEYHAYMIYTATAAVLLDFLAHFFARQDEQTKHLTKITGLVSIPVWCFVCYVTYF